MASVASKRVAGTGPSTCRAGSPWWSDPQRVRLTSCRGSRVAVALEPRRYWCAYQRHCGNVGAMVSTHKRATSHGRPTQETAGTNPRTGRRYFLTQPATTSSSNYMSKLVWYFYFRAWYSGIKRRLWWFPSHRSASLLSSLVLSVPGVEVFRLLSSWSLQVYTSWDPDSVPVTILLSSILFVTD